MLKAQINVNYGKQVSFQSAKCSPAHILQQKSARHSQMLRLYFLISVIMSFARTICDATSGFLPDYAPKTTCWTNTPDDKNKASPKTHPRELPLRSLRKNGVARQNLLKDPFQHIRSLKLWQRR